MKLAAGLLVAGVADADGSLNDSAPRTGYANSGISSKYKTKDEGLFFSQASS